MEAGAKGGLVWQEQLMNAAHIVPSIGMISAFGVLVYEAFAEKESKMKQ